MVTLGTAVDGRQSSGARRADGASPTTSRKDACAGYYPECNPLVPLWHHAEGSKVPAAKSIPVRVIGTQSNKEAIP